MKKKRHAERNKGIETGFSMTPRYQEANDTLPLSKKIVVSSPLKTLIDNKTSEIEPPGWLDRVITQYYPHITLNSASAGEVRDDIKFHLNKLTYTIKEGCGKPIPLSKLKDLDILDLACGSEKAERRSLMEHPNLCRALKVLGCNVVGVDKYYPRYNPEGKGVKEDWKFVKLDLVNNIPGLKAGACVS